MTSKEDPFRQEKNLKGVCPVYRGVCPVYRGVCPVYRGVSRVQGRVSRVQMCPAYRVMCPVYRGVSHVQGRVPCTGACAQRDLQEAFARRPMQRRLIVLAGFVDVGAGFDEGNGVLG